MPARLIAETGEYAGAEYPLTPKGAVLGRLKSNDIEVVDTKASRRHTRVALHAGAWFVEDLQSSNGTFLNGAQIERAEITTGDKISIGKTVYRFEDDEESGAVAAPPPRPAAQPAPARRPAPKPAPAPVDEPDELHLEEPEELGLDDGGGADAPAAPRAPAAPSSKPQPTPKPAVSATGHGLVSLSGTPRGARSGMLGGEVGQRDWRFQLLVYVAAGAIFVGLTWGAFRLMDGLLGDPAEPQPVPAPAAGE